MRCFFYESGQIMRVDSYGREIRADDTSDESLADRFD